MDLIPSKYQTAFFNDVKLGKGNTIVEALAGSGKTTSIIKSLSFIDPKLQTILVAFNKKIANELKEKAPNHVEVKTLHAIGLKYISKRFPGIKVNFDKVDNILDKMFKKDKKYLSLLPSLDKTISLSKGCLASTSEEISDIIDDFEIDFDDNLISETDFINHVQFALDFCKRNTNEINFDDMIWFPNVHEITMPKYDRLFVDEAQDLNKAQRELCLRMIKKTGRTFVIGDKHQAIYQFRGADSASIDNFQNALDAKMLPLSITYRCPITVTKEAQKIVSAIEWAPAAIDGIVDNKTQQDMLLNAPLGCFIISRTNAPLIRIAMNYIKRGIPANIQGRNIGEGLLFLVKKSRCKHLDSFITFLDKWEKKEVARVIAKKKNPSFIQDKAECLRTLAETCANVDEIKAKIFELFHEKTADNIINCGTTHQFKGLENDIVYMLINTFNEGKEEERNCKYVAITRAKKELHYVSYNKNSFV